MKKVLVLAYQLSPFRGSEYSVGWNYVINMSKNNLLTVIYGASGNHLGDTLELEEYSKLNTIPNVNFVPVKSNDKINRLNSLNKKGKFVYSFYFAYKEWHKLVFLKVNELCLTEKFDVVHFLNPIGYREPGFLWKLNLPYIWGPIGGIQNIPFNMFAAFSLNGKIKFAVRNIVNFFQFRVNFTLQKVLRNTDVLLASTSENGSSLFRRFKKDYFYIPENGLLRVPINLSLDKYDVSLLQLVWIGNINDGKALMILLNALRKVKYSNYRLNIVGDGSLREYLINYSIANRINENIYWHGNIPREKVLAILNNSHLHISSSLIEGNPTVIWEAMSVNVPTMSLDICGMHDTICDKCGIKIPLNNYKQVVSDFAKNISNFCNNISSLKTLSEGTHKCAQKYTWDKRIVFFNRMYDLAIENHAKRQK